MSPREKGQLPKAYLRLDPNIDQTHPDNLDEFVRLLCAANRQPHRGTFRNRPTLEAVMGKAPVRRFYARGDVLDLDGGAVLVPGWEHWQEGDLNVAERMRRLRARNREADTPASLPPSPPVTPTVTAPVTNPIPPSEASGVRRQARDSQKAPTASARRPAARPTTNRDVDEARLTKEQLDAWQSFGPEWSAFRDAWIGRGFLWPPAGEPGDDDTSQRGLLWQVLDAQPTNLLAWVKEAPGRTTRQVIAYVLGQWHDVRQAVDEDEPDAPTPPGERHADAERLGGILARVAR